MLASALSALYRNAVRPLGAIRRAVRGRRPNADSVSHDPCGEVARKRIGQMMTEEVEQIELEASLDVGQSSSAIPSPDRSAPP
jgi:hypothetical protein